MHAQEVSKDIRLVNVRDLGGPYEERICSSRCRSREVDCLDSLCFLSAVAVQRHQKAVLSVKNSRVASWLCRRFLLPASDTMVVSSSPSLGESCSVTPWAPSSFSAFSSVHRTERVANLLSSCLEDILNLNTRRKAHSGILSYEILCAIMPRPLHNATPLWTMIMSRCSEPEQIMLMGCSCTSLKRSGQHMGHNA